MEKFDTQHLLDLAQQKQFRKLKEILVKENEVDIATFLTELDEERKVAVFRLLPKDLASDVFACLEVDQQQVIINSITDKELGAIIDDLYVDDAVDLMEELPANVVKRVMLY